MTDSFKARIRVPTAEPYAYLEIDAEGSPEAIFSAYERFNALVKVGAGLPDKEWRGCLDKYLAGKGMSAENMEQMNAAQKWMIHELDKSATRTK